VIQRIIRENFLLVNQQHLARMDAASLTQMSHPYLLLSDSTNYPGNLLVGVSATSGVGRGLTNKNIKVVEIPSTFNGKEVVEIGYYAFDSTGITSVFIPRTIYCIHIGAFEQCESLSEVRFEEGSRLWKFGRWVFGWCYALKKIDIPASVTSIEIDSNYKFFGYVSLDCFSYAGTTDFASLSHFFNTVTNVYVSNSYPSSTFAGKTVTKGTQACGVSYEHFEVPTRTLTPTRTIALKCSVAIVPTYFPIQLYILLLLQS
jgi:hypothetical protein